MAKKPPKFTNKTETAHLAKLERVLANAISFF